MRSRNLIRMMMLVVASSVSLLTMRACGSSGSSDHATTDVARTGVEGICANQQAVAAAGSADDSLPPVTLPPDLAKSLKSADSSTAALLQQATSCGPPPTDDGP